LDKPPSGRWPSRLAAVPGTFFLAAVLAGLFTASPDAASWLFLCLPLWALLYAGFEVGRFYYGRKGGSGPGPDAPK
jgi:Sec-independent protein secretion pathway component TatC